MKSAGFERGRPARSLSMSDDDSFPTALGPH